MMLFWLWLWLLSCVLTALNLGVAAYDKNTHSAMGWASAMMLSISGTLNTLH